MCVAVWLVVLGLIQPAFAQAARMPAQGGLAPLQGSIGSLNRLYDLEADEALGGHTMARHVGRTDAQLAERLQRERDISAASTYTDALIEIGRAHV